MKKTNLSFLLILCTLFLGLTQVKAQDFVPEPGVKYRIVGDEVTTINGLLAYPGTSAGANLLVTLAPTEGQIVDFEFEAVDPATDPASYFVKVSGTDLYVLQDGSATSNNMRAKLKSALTSETDIKNRMTWTLPLRSSVDEKNYYSLLNGQERGIKFNGVGQNVVRYSNANDNGAKYLIIKSDDYFSTLGLEAKITEAEAALNDTEGGTEPGKYPLDARADLQQAINTAKGIVSTPSGLTQAVVDEATAVLSASIETYLAAKIIVPFAPDASKMYRITCAANNALYAYYNASNTYFCPKEGTSGDQLFQFILSDGKYKVKNTAQGNYFRVRSDGQAIQGTTSETDQRTFFTMEYAETIDGISYYYFKCNYDGSKVTTLYFSTDNYLRSSDAFGKSNALTKEGVENAGYKFAIVEAGADEVLPVEVEKLNAAIALAEPVALKDSVPAAIATLFNEKITAAKALAETTDASQIDNIRSATSELETLTTPINNIDKTIKEAGVLSRKETLPPALKEALDNAIASALAITTVDQIEPTIASLKLVISNAGSLESVISEAGQLLEKENVPDGIKTMLRDAIAAALEIEPGEGEAPEVTQLKALIETAKSFENSITAAKAVVKPENFPAAVQTAFTDSINAAVNIAEANFENAETILSQLKGMTLIATDLSASITAANEALVKESSWGFGEAEKTALNNALAAATTGFTVFDPATIGGVITALNEATATYLASELIPTLEPEGGVLYRIVTADPTLGYLYAETDANKSIKFKTGLSEDQLFKFDEVEGFYQVKPVLYPDSMLYSRYRPGTDSGRNTISVAKNEGEGLSSGEKLAEGNSRFVFAYAKTVNEVHYFYLKTKDGVYARFDGSGVLRTYAKPDGSDKELFQIVADGAVSKTALQGAITDAEYLLENTVVGTNAGEYPAENHELLETALTQAKEVYNNADVTQEEVDPAVIALKTAIDEYASSKIIILDTKKVYYILGKGGFYIGRADELGETRVSTRNIETDAATVYPVIAIPVEGSLNTYNFQRYNPSSEIVEYLINDGSYNVRFRPEGQNVGANLPTTNIKLFDVDGEYMKLKFESNKFLGANSTGVNQNTAADKDGNSDAHYWKFVENKKASLALVITLAEELTEANYTTDSWTAMQEKLTAAKNVAPDATDEQIDAAVSGLSAAMDALVDTQALKTLIESAEALTEASYTVASWAVLTDKLTQAKTIAEKGNASDEEVTNAVAELNSAIEGLINISALKTLIASTEDFAEVDYTAGSWTVLQAGLAGAETALTATAQIDVDNALTTLQAAIDALVNISSLKTLIASVADLTEETYSAASWTVLQTALTAANGAVENATTQEVADDTLSALELALDSLVDITALKTLVASTEDLIESDYTTVSWAALQTALTTANEVMEDALAESEVDSAIDALQAAIDGLTIDDGKSDLEAKGIVIYVSDRELVVDNLQGEVAISVYDLSGRRVSFDISTGKQYTRTLPSGNYVVALSGYANGSEIVVVK